MVVANCAPHPAAFGGFPLPRRGRGWKFRPYRPGYAQLFEMDGSNFRHWPGFCASRSATA